MARKWRVTRTFPAGRKAALCKQPSIKPHWVNEIIDPVSSTFNDIECRSAVRDESDGTSSKMVRAR